MLILPSGNWIKHFCHPHKLRPYWEKTSFLNYFENKHCLNSAVCAEISTSYPLWQFATLRFMSKQPQSSWTSYSNNFIPAWVGAIRIFGWLFEATDNISSFNWYELFLWHIILKRDARDTIEMCANNVSHMPSTSLGNTGTVAEVNETSIEANRCSGFVGWLNSKEYSTRGLWGSARTGKQRTRKDPINNMYNTEGRLFYIYKWGKMKRTEITGVSLVVNENGAESRENYYSAINQRAPNHDCRLIYATLSVTAKSSAARYAKAIEYKLFTQIWNKYLLTLI